MPKGIPLTEEELARRRREIVNAALKLFYEKGFLETSMREVATAAGVGKSTLYDYFATKDDILVSFFEQELQWITQRAEEIYRQDLPAEEKLRQITQVHLKYLLDNKSFYIKLTVEAQRLSLTSQQRIQAGRHAYQDLICRIIQDGVAEGSFRPVDPLLAMRLILAALTPVAFTTRPTGTPQEMLASSLDILLNGLKA